MDSTVLFFSPLSPLFAVGITSDGKSTNSLDVLCHILFHLYTLLWNLVCSRDDFIQFAIFISFNHRALLLIRSRVVHWTADAVFSVALRFFLFLTSVFLPLTSFHIPCYSIRIFSFFVVVWMCLIFFILEYCYWSWCTFYCQGSGNVSEKENAHNNNKTKKKKDE